MPTPVTPAQRIPRLRLRLTRVAEAMVRRGHPWVYSDSIVEQNRVGEVGELGVIYDGKDQFLAIGLYDPDSPLRLRVLHTGKPATINEEWWLARLQEALARRTGLFDEETTGYRCINGESDGWPGLVLDRYGETYVVKVYTAAWFPRLLEIKNLITQILPSSRLVLRLSRNIQNVGQETRTWRDGAVIAGEDNDLPAQFLENGLLFEADVVRGQKTGFFLDQRENRSRVEKLASGRRVLNVFSFSGGFSVYAARGGARAVDSLDISTHALASCERNFALNERIKLVAACRRRSVKADAFEWLKAQSGAVYDLVVLDPPSLAKRNVDRAHALSGYEDLVRNAVRFVARDGILVAASCSAHIKSEEFSSLVLTECRRSGRKTELMETTGHPADHRATFSEGEYLKAVYVRFDGHG